jgi:hypothetical protein
VSALDDFAAQLLEEAKRFREKAAEETDPSGRDAYLHAALLTGFCALEALVNAVADDFLVAGELAVLERGLLAEREVELRNGRYVLSAKLKMSRLEDRLEFLVRKYSGKPIDKSAAWWSGLTEGLKARNALAHSRDAQALTDAEVARALTAIVEAVSILYLAVYKRKYPAATRELHSRLQF